MGLQVEQGLYGAEGYVRGIPRMGRSLLMQEVILNMRMPTWTPKVCKIMAFMAISMGLGPLFYILLGFR